LKTDYIWQNDLENFEDAKELIEYAFNDHNNYRPHSSIDYLTPVEFENRYNNNGEFGNKVIEERIKRKINIKMLNESVSILH